jgi:serine/threonine-protein kinase
LDERLECRPALSPIVVAKYLEARSNPSRLKQFRKVRSQLQQASQHAARHLTDDQGVLNPGLMPQTVADLMRLAPTKSEIDDELVSRWNAISEVWREHPPFRDAVLRYATAGAWHDPASAGLWPEVVYPLIERARRQRHMRSRIEAFWEAICERITFLPDPGARMERALRAEISEEIVEQLDVAAVAYLDEHVVEAEEGPEDDEDRLNLGEGLAPATVAELQSVEPDRGFCRFDSDEPVRFTLGELRALWRESIQSLKAGVEGGTRTATSVMPIGSYRLTVIPSVRARAAGQVAIQGMANKQIEMIVPPFAGSGKDSAPVVAIWTYPVGSLAITYLDHLHHQNFICWDAEAGRQFHFSDPVSFNQTLDQLGLEVPSGLDRVLSRR